MRIRSSRSTRTRTRAPRDELKARFSRTSCTERQTLSEGEDHLCNSKTNIPRKKKTCNRERHSWEPLPAAVPFYARDSRSEEQEPSAPGCWPMGIVPALADEGSGSLTQGDVAILRFLAAAEIIETDLWQQYNELGGIQDSEVPGGSGSRRLHRGPASAGWGHGPVYPRQYRG